MNSQKLRAFAALLLACSLTGCMDAGAGGATARQKTYKVTGKVTMSGAPVANAIVTFSPSAQQPAATGRTDTEGKFTLTTYDSGDGAAAGDYTALVTKEGASTLSPTAPGHDPTGTKPAEVGMHDAQKPAGPTGLLPSKYSSATSSDLKVTVKTDGANEVALDLKP